MQTDLDTSATGAMSPEEYEYITSATTFARMVERLTRWTIGKKDRGLLNYTDARAAGPAIWTPLCEFLDGITRNQNTGTPTYGMVEPQNLEEDGCITLVALPPSMVSDVWKSGTPWKPDSFSITDFRDRPVLGSMKVVREKFQRPYPAFCRVSDSQAKGRLARMACVRNGFPGVSKTGDVSVTATLCEWRWIEQRMKLPEAERPNGVAEIYEYAMARPGFKEFLAGEPAPSSDSPRTIENKKPEGRTARQ